MQRIGEGRKLDMLMTETNIIIFSEINTGRQKNWAV